jgi:hypothetical protein
MLLSVRVGQVVNVRFKTEDLLGSWTVAAETRISGAASSASHPCERT